MQISKRERNILLMAAVVALLFAATNILPAVQNFYQFRKGTIDSVQLDIEREQRLIQDTASWRERRVEVESKIAELQGQLFTGETIPIVEANIQRALSLHARDSGISVSSTRLAEQLESPDWLLIQQEMSFRTNDAANTVSFLEKLQSSAPRLRVTEFSVNRSRNQYSGSITVVGFARSAGLINDE